jgi:hypothetical protein
VIDRSPIELGASVVYLALGVALIYGVANTQVTNSEAVGLAVLVVLAVGHPLFGYLVGRWWAVFLPYAIVLLAIPAGYPPTDDWEPLPIWYAQGFIATIEAVLMVPGIGLRKLRDASRDAAD